VKERELSSGPSTSTRKTKERTNLTIELFNFYLDELDALGTSQDDNYEQRLRQFELSRPTWGKGHTRLNVAGDSSMGRGGVLDEVLRSRGSSDLLCDLLTLPGWRLNVVRFGAVRTGDTERLERGMAWPFFKGKELGGPDRRFFTSFSFLFWALLLSSELSGIARSQLRDDLKRTTFWLAPCEGKGTSCASALPWSRSLSLLLLSWSGTCYALGDELLFLSRRERNEWGLGEGWI